MSNKTADLSQKIENWKRSLLDMTKRNRLLWYKPYRVNSLELISEVFDTPTEAKNEILSVANGNSKLKFDPTFQTRLNESLKELEDIRDSSESEPGEALLEQIKQLEKRLSLIQKRDKALRGISKRAQDEYNERGLNIAYIAYGFIKWYEREDSEDLVSSPLILIPVKFSQISRISDFEVELNLDEEISLNPVVVKKFNDDFKIDFSNIVINPENLDSALDEIGEMIEREKRWQIVPEIWLDTFNFQNLVIWNDLDKNSNIIEESPFGQILGGDDPCDVGIEYNDEEITLDKIRSKDLPCILPADSSQKEAIERAKRGQSFVIQGPPGTGKSQTIANIIATSLHAGKKVLFVSEKQAALDVVYHKLQLANLSDFCLVMHNSKQKKANVREQLRDIVELAADKKKVSDESLNEYNKLDSSIQTLNDYNEELHKELDCGKTPFFILGELASLQSTKNVPFVFPDGFDYGKEYDTSVRPMFNEVDQYAKSLIDNTDHFKNSKWNLYSEDFNASTRRIAEEQIGDIKIEVFNKIASCFSQEKITENSNSKDLKTKIKEFCDLFKDIPFNIVTLDDLTGSIKNIEVIEADIKKIGEQYAKDRDVENDNIQTEKDSYEKLTKKAIEKHNGALESIKNHYSSNVEKENESFNAKIKGIDDTVSSKINEQKDNIAKLEGKKTDIATYDAQIEEAQKSIGEKYDLKIFGIDNLETRYKKLKNIYSSPLKRLSSDYKQLITELVELSLDRNKYSDHVWALEQILFVNNTRDKRAKLDAQIKEGIEDANNSIKELKDYKKDKTEDFNKKHSEKLASIKNIFDTDTKDENERHKQLTAQNEKNYNDVINAINQRIKKLNTQYELDLSTKKSELARLFEQDGAIMQRDIIAIEELLRDIDFSELDEYQTYMINKNKLINNYHFIDFIDKIENSDVVYNASEICDIFRKRFFELLLEKTEFSSKYYNYSRSEHDQVVSDFKNYDRNTRKISAAVIRHKLLNEMPSMTGFSTYSSAHNGEIGLLKRELNKKTRLMPTRRLIESLPVLLPLLKPCMMMSPLTVSSYFGKNPSLKFDIVIFDEASQVKPEYAVPAIVRGKQIIVAGDSKQMPPTRFFDAAIDQDEYLAEDEIDDSDLESILEEISVKLPDVYLNWHYRSKDESLISFSNNKFYNSRLFTFPSTDIDNKDTGVSFIYCENGLWNSKSGNIPEAELVANEVYKHYKNRPNDTLGVIAFGVSQEVAIEEAIDRMLDAHPEIEEVFTQNNDEPFFIKNLENVQGDERDCIILSCGYGKDDSGSFKMRFGPLAMNGGERRLNVAISRSRKHMTVVSSFKASEIRVDNNRNREYIRDFIDYAEHGIVALLGKDENDMDSGDKEYTPTFDSDFEEAVYNFIVSNGFKVKTQVGSSGYKIDMAVLHPEIDGRYVLAIECDGATYHSSRMARDRDILRQDILESLGWRFHRIWSTNWINDETREKQKLISAINNAISSYGQKQTNDSVGDSINSPSSHAEDEQPEEYEIKLEDDNELEEIYNKFYREHINSYLSTYYVNDAFNFYRHAPIEEILRAVIKFRNGYAPVDLYKEINQKVFGKWRFSDIARGAFERNLKKLVDDGTIDVVDGSIVCK